MLGRASIVAAAMVACGIASATAGHPALRIPDRSPLTVRGTGFHPRERVRVTLVVNRRFVRRTRTGSSGSFRVVFRRLSVGECASFQLRAVGSKGSRAWYKPPPFACGAEIGPR